MDVFLPFIEENTSGEVLLIVDDCKSHGDLNDTNGIVRIMHLPPNYTRVHQSMGVGVIVATKLHYRRRLLAYRADNCAKQLFSGMKPSERK